MVDPFIGSTFGAKSQLTVVGVCEREYCKPLKYQLVCSICDEDEMHRGRIYISKKGWLNEGRIPCQCEKKGLNRKEQAARIVSACSERELEFLGFVGEYNGTYTKLKLRCLRDGHEWETSSVNNFFAKGRGRGCRICANASMLPPDEESIKEFLSTGAFVEGTRFWRLPLDPQNRWACHCPICSNDELVKQGLCSGVFISTRSSLRKGSKSCRCSKPMLTPEQREYQVRKRIKDENLPYKFLGWKGEWEGANTRVHLYCEEHGDFSPVVHSFMVGTLCASCAKTGFDPNKRAFVYVLRAEGICGEFTGYGITGNAVARLRKHSRNLSREGFSMAEHQVFPVSGHDAIHIEKCIKENFTRCPQVVEGFMTEATHSHLYHNVISFIQQSLSSSTPQ